MYGYIRRWENSGINQKDFCKKEGINYYKFKYWKTQQNKEHRVVKQSNVDLPQDFISVNISSLEKYFSGVEITFPNGVRLNCEQGLQADQIKELIKFF